MLNFYVPLICFSALRGANEVMQMYCTVHIDEKQKK